MGFGIICIECFLSPRNFTQIFFQMYYISFQIAKVKGKRKVPQIDGLHDSNSSSDENDLTDIDMLQVDGPSDVKKSKKTNLQKLKPKETKKSVSNKTLKPVEKKLTKPSLSKLRREKVGSLKKNKNSQSEDSEEDFVMSPVKEMSSHVSPRGTVDVKNDIINLIKSRIAEQKHIDRGRLVRKREKSYADIDSDSDYAPEPIKKKHHDSDSERDFVPKMKVKKRIRVKKEGSALKVIPSESDLDESGKKKNKGINVWVEVFLEAEEKWITADVVRGQVHCVNEIYVSLVIYCYFYNYGPNENT